jgi:hypothetical protein
LKEPPNVRSEHGWRWSTGMSLQRELRRKRVFPQCDLDVERIANDAAGEQKCAGYVTKYFADVGAEDGVFFASEFHPSPRCPLK